LAAPAAGPACAQTAPFDWTGFYVGLNGGFGGDEFKYPASGSFTSGSSSGSIAGEGHITSSGVLGGAQAGYDYLTSTNWLFGVEADIAASGIKGEIGASGSAAGSLAGTASLSASSEIRYLGTVRGRAGHVWERILAYATAGFAYGDVRSGLDLNIVPVSAPVTAVSVSRTASHTGWTVGVGAEYALNDRLTFRTEYLYVDLGESGLIDTPFSLLGISGNADVKVSATANILRVGLNYKLGGG
jgi:outer membrane immunogenic protein